MNDSPKVNSISRQAKKHLTFFLAILIIAAAVFTSVATRKADNSGRAYRIGILIRGTGYEPAVEGYKKRLAELGHEEGRNTIFDIRLTSNREELPLVARELAESGVDLIHTYSTPATQAAYLATRDMSNPTPVVFGSMGDPLISGVIKDIQHPGTNVTGVASLSTQLTAKRLELLKRIKPDIRKVAMPHTAEEAGDVAATRSVVIAKEAANRLGIELLFFPVNTAKDNIEAARNITSKVAEGLIVGGDSLVWGSIDEYIAQSIKEKLLFAAFDVNQVKKGALVGFGPDYYTVGRQAAEISHQILNGKKPEGIPVEVPEKLILAVNLATARSIDLELSPQFLEEADVVFGEK